MLCFKEGFGLCFQRSFASDKLGFVLKYCLVIYQNMETLWNTEQYLTPSKFSSIICKDFGKIHFATVNAFYGHVVPAFVSDTSPKWIGREGLRENRTGTTVGNKVHTEQAFKRYKKLAHLTRIFTSDNLEAPVLCSGIRCVWSDIFVFLVSLMLRL